MEIVIRSSRLEFMQLTTLLNLKKIKKATPKKNTDLFWPVWRWAHCVHSAARCKQALCNPENEAHSLMQRRPAHRRALKSCCCCDPCRSCHAGWPSRRSGCSHCSNCCSHQRAQRQPQWKSKAAHRIRVNFYLWLLNPSDVSLEEKRRWGARC